MSYAYVIQVLVTRLLEAYSRNDVSYVISVDFVT